MPDLASLVCDDVLRWAEEYQGKKFHACLTDAPYSLGNGQRGFMNSAWDTSIAFRPATWQALAQHLLPGAFLMVFASARGWHRLACAIEDAGLILHPSIFGWGFGSGFPKATRIDTAIDKASGLEREVQGYYDHRGIQDGYQRRSNGATGESQCSGGRHSLTPVTAPATPLAQAWAGHRYGLQALKPALEPVIIAQVPYLGRPVDSITQTGAGGLWIEGGRLATTEIGGARTPGPARMLQSGWHMADASTGSGATSPSGRWPTNLALCHTPQCVRVGDREVQGTNIPGPGARAVGYGATGEGRGGIQRYASPDSTETVPAYVCAEDCPVAALDGQAGERNGDTGPASRFFYTASWALDVAEQLAQAEPLRYQAKASRHERDAGLEGIPRTHAPLFTDGTVRHCPVHQASIPSGSVLYRCGCAIVYSANADQGGGPGVRHANTHPTVKPLTLLKWLATLLLPPAAYAPRRILIPFAGSGSECIGALLAGWEHVLGIEQDPAYVDIARQRIAWWTGFTPPQTTSPSPRASQPPGHATQLPLF